MNDQSYCMICGEDLDSKPKTTNDQLCNKCAKRAFVCKKCKSRSFAATKEDRLCLACLHAKYGGKHVRQHSHIEEFIKTHGRRDCSLLRALYKLDERLTLEDASNCPGLTLFDPPGKHRGTILYDPAKTPSNAFTFATTAGDDVHFSLLVDDALVSDNSPVVMTVPMGKGSGSDVNMILGATLREFLCLGCTQGYFDLDQFLYDPEEAIEQLMCSPEESENDDCERATLGIYRRELGLAPWTDIKARLKQLKRAYQGRLLFTTE